MMQSTLGGGGGGVKRKVIMELASLRASPPAVLGPRATMQARYSTPGAMSKSWENKGPVPSEVGPLPIKGEM